MLIDVYSLLSLNILFQIQYIKLLNKSITKLILVDTYLNVISIIEIEVKFEIVLNKILDEGTVSIYNPTTIKIISKRTLILFSWIFTNVNKIDFLLLFIINFNNGRNLFIANIIFVIIKTKNIIDDTKSCYKSKNTVESKEEYIFLDEHKHLISI